MNIKNPYASAWYLAERKRQIERANQKRFERRGAVVLFALMVLAIAIMALCPSPARSQQILQFGAEWCGPCRQMAPAVESAKRSGIAIRHVDVDRESELAKQYGIESVPAMVALDSNGEQVGSTIVGCRPLGDIQQLWATVAKTEPTRTTAATNNAAHCRIEVGRGELSCGSGTLIAANDRTGLVLTCSHLFDDGTDPILCRFPSGSFYARLIARDAANDLAAVLIRRPSVTPVKVDDATPTGEAIVSGYGPDSHFRQVAGRVIDWTTPQGATDKSAILSVDSRPGDSGGGILNARGVLIGVNWGCSDGHAYITCGRPLHEFLQRVFVRKTQCVACQGGSCSVGVGVGGYILPYRNEQAELMAGWRHWADGVNACIKQLQDDACRCSRQQQPQPTIDTNALRGQLEATIDARFKSLAVGGSGNADCVSQVQLKTTCDEMEKRLNASNQQIAQLTLQIQKMQQAIAMASTPRPFYLRVSRDSQYQSVSPGQYVTLPLSKQ